MKKIQVKIFGSSICAKFEKNQSVILGYAFTCESYVYTHIYNSMAGLYIRLLDSDRFAIFTLQKKYVLVAKYPTARRKNNFHVSIFLLLYKIQ